MSSITRRWDVSAARRYTDRNGVEKTSWVNVGRAVEWDGERIQVELNALPCFPEWDGKISLFVPRDKDAAQPARAVAPKPAKTDDFEDSSIPF